MRALSALAAMVGRSSIESPSTPLTGRLLSAASDEWGSPRGHERVDPLRISTALRCVQILSAGVAGCPLKVQSTKDGADVAIPALTRLTAGTTPFELWETTVAHLALAGNAYLRKVRTRDGRLVDLVPILPSRVHVDVDDGPVATELGRPWVKKFTVDGTVPLTEWDVLHIPAFSWNGVTGVSVIENLRLTWEAAHHTERVAAELFEHGMMQTRYLKTDATLDSEQAMIAKARWRALNGGADNAHDLLIVDAGGSLEQLALSPEDAQWLESRRFSTTEIGRIFGLPGWLLNDQEKSTSWGSGMEQQLIAMVTFSLKPYFQRIEQRVTREICDPKAEKAEFKIEGLLRGDSTARAAFYASGIQHGWMVPNEPRALENMQPVEWGDKPYRPFNEPANGSSQTGAGNASSNG